MEKKKKKENIIDDNCVKSTVVSDQREKVLLEKHIAFSVKSVL